MSKENDQLTPMLRQFMQAKENHPDAILFFRMGDFYEMFFEDAEVAAPILDIALTKRGKHKGEAVPMCGVPVHSMGQYLSKLVSAGKKVAICEQLEDPRAAKGIVKRDVVRVVSPGLLVPDDGSLQKENNFLVCLAWQAISPVYGVASLDLSTGEFRLTEIDHEDALFSELSRLSPSEVLLAEGMKGAHLVKRLEGMFAGIFVGYRQDEWFCAKRAEKVIEGHFRLKGLEGLGLNVVSTGLSACGALLIYVLETQKNAISHIKPPLFYSLASCLVMDESTQRNLELVANSLDRSKKGSLLATLDKTVTAMGARLMRNWLLYPLKDLVGIEKRQEAVAELKECGQKRLELRAHLSKVSDMERLVTRLSMASAGPRDMLALKNSLQASQNVKSCLSGFVSSALLCEFLEELNPLPEVASLIESAIREDAPQMLRDARVICEGFSPELDELIHIQRNARELIAGIEQRERQRTGINTLKVGFNRVFGYYIEITRSHLEKVPQDFIRRQTLAGAERFISEELKNLEEKILGAEERRIALELRLFEQIRAEIIQHVGVIQKTASCLGAIDVLAALSQVAEESGYVRPQLEASCELDITRGRHPVVEKGLPSGEFVPNSIFLGEKADRMLIITGPNMAGKSTVLRQTALIVLMAQMGSFVPVDAAKIGLADRIFCRVGATDYLVRGQSTFMVEMSETANILHNATTQSLVVLDEIGRGTSTYDGLSIARAVAEYLVQKDKKGVRTLFATHYHELTELALTEPKVTNLHVSIKEWQDELVFLHVLEPGPTDKSYGIEVAGLAGVPVSVIERAKELLSKVTENKPDLRQLSNNIFTNKENSVKKRGGKRHVPGLSYGILPLFPEMDKVKQRLKEIEPDILTPLEALSLIYELKKLAGSNS